MRSWLQKLGEIIPGRFNSCTVAWLLVAPFTLHEHEHEHEYEFLIFACRAVNPMKAGACVIPSSFNASPARTIPL
jgi:hypothetical protein